MRMTEAIAARVFSDQTLPAPAQDKETNWQCQQCHLMIKWLSHPVYVTKQRLAKISGISRREIEQLIESNVLPCYLPPGAKRAKFSIKDLMQAMEAYKKS